jgi:hypothetical protein
LGPYIDAIKVKQLNNKSSRKHCPCTKELPAFLGCDAGGYGGGGGE